METLVVQIWIGQLVRGYHNRKEGDENRRKMFTIISFALLVGIVFFLTGCDNQEEVFSEHKGEVDVGVRVIERDLTDRGRNMSYWYERGGDVEASIELLELLGNPIESQEEAIEIANDILDAGLLSDELVLSDITHDPNQNIWIFNYGMNEPETLGWSAHVAIDGNTGELLRRWSE